MNYDLDDLPIYHYSADYSNSTEQQINSKLGDSNAIQRKQLELILQQQKMLEEMKADAEKEAKENQKNTSWNKKATIISIVIVVISLFVSIANFVVFVL
ncbi:MAG: hypothetical protein R3Y58_07360 [Eubacteriales bacterium]